MAFWDGYLQGQQAADNSVAAFNRAQDTPIARQAALEQLQSLRQTNALNQIKLNQQTDLVGEIGARNQERNAAQSAAVQLSNTDAPAPQQSTAAQLTLPSTPAQSEAVQQLQSIPGGSPKYSMMPQTGVDADIQSAMGGAPAPTSSAAKLGSNAQLQIDPTLSGVLPASQDQPPSKPIEQYGQVQNVVTGSTTPAQPPQTQTQAAAPTMHEAPSQAYMKELDHWKNWWVGRDGAKAEAYNAQYNAEAQKIGQMAAYGVSNLPDLYTLQAKTSMTASHADMVEKGMKLVFEGFEKAGTSGVVAMAPQIQQLPGLEKFDPSKIAIDPSGRFMSTLMPDGSSIIADREHPKEWKLEPASEITLFKQGYLQDHPNAPLSDVSRAFQQFQINKVAAGKSLNVLNAVPRETMIGVDGSGNAVYKDSHGGAPFQYNSAQKQTAYTGSIFTKNESMNLGGNTPDPVTGLTPVQVKANAKALQDPVNLRTVQLINGVTPVGQKFMQAINNLPDDTPIAAVTGILRGSGIQLNNRQINDFQTFATEFPREAQRAMVGSGQTAQKSLDQQGELFAKAKTVGNLKSSLGIVLDILQDRKDGVLAPVFPPNGHPIKNGHTPTPGGVDTSRPVTKGSVTGYQQADGSVLDASGKMLNAAPAPAAQPQIAPAGTRVPKKGGGMYTSDGKGGWY